MNRQQRRANDRRRTPKAMLDGFRIFLAVDECVVVEEALALWLHQTRDDLAGVELTAQHRWSLERGERVRQALSAALEERPWVDIDPHRQEPG